jgi:tricorn protease
MIATLARCVKGGVVKRFTLALIGVLAICAPAVTAFAEEAHLMRWADIHEDQVVFTYEDDLWLVASGGGTARRITSHPGAERYAKFSPDGSLIAFTGSYDGGSDVYVIDARGGVPRRLSFHPSSDRVLGWDPSGEAVLFRSRREYPTRAERLYLISVEGGMPIKLPVDRAGLAALSPDGSSIAYNRFSREDRTWKRYQGGLAQDLWLGRLAAGDFRRVTDWPGSDNYPMWQGDSIYFSSDRRFGTLNLYRYDVATAAVEALTSYRDYDVKYPSIGPGAIVYQYGESLHLLDLATGTVEKLAVRLASDRVPMWGEYADVDEHNGSFRVSPDGEQLLLEARGEILSIPAEEGEAQNLTRSSGSREKNAVWSPDGELVALVSDRGGNEAVWLIDSNGEWRRLTEGSPYLLQPVWSPDSKYLLYSDKEMKLKLVEVATASVRVIDQGPVDDGWERWGIQDYLWSPDSRWIAYTRLEPTLYESIHLYSMDTGKTMAMTDDVTSDWSPSFSPDGSYLYFLSNRSFNPVMGLVDQTHVFVNMALPYVVVLKDGEASPFAPSPGDDDEDGGEDDSEEVTVRVDFDGLGNRILAAEGVERGNYFRLEATDDGFLYLAKPELEFLKYQTVNDRSSDKLELYHYDLAKKETTKLMDGVNNYHLSADRSKMVYRAGSKYGVVDTGSEAKPGDGAVDLGGVRIKVDKQDEYLQIFNEAWRIQSDWFYDPGMHGVDWQAVGEKYRRFVPSCGNRSDLNYLIGEMIAELNIGHTYVGGGEYGDRGKRVPVGLLGADFDQPEGAAYHRIAHIIPGTSWRSSERSPLRELGCDIRDGDYLISVEGEELRAQDNVYSVFEDTVGRTVSITTNRRPSADGALKCQVRPIRSEFGIRYREWVEANRAKVDEASGGTIGYLHLPNMMEAGLIEFARAYYPLYRKQGIIIDERYNGGGFVADMIIDRLERELWAITVPREGMTIPDPERVFHGHLVVVMNEDTGSNGEYFAEAIKLKGLATVIGRRTWGGAVGIEPHQDLVDGGQVTPPQFAPYGLDGQWMIEGHGVEPDIDVDNLPADVLAGRDTQLESAIEYLQRKIAEDPREIPPRPPYPVKAKPAE